MSKILIVEDEPFIAEDLSGLLCDAGYEVETCLQFHKVLDAIMTFQPDLILMDISLDRGNSGIKLSMQVRKQFDLPIIFLTSHSDPQTISLAKETEPVGYLVKPIQVHTLVSTIEIGFKQAEILRELKSDSDAIFLRHNGKMVKVKYNEILFAKANDNYTDIHTSSQTILLTKTLKQVESCLPKRHFQRVHRSFLINIDKVLSFEEGGVSIDGKYIPVGRNYREQLHRMFNTL